MADRRLLRSPVIVFLIQLQTGNSDGIGVVIYWISRPKGMLCKLIKGSESDRFFRNLLFKAFHEQIKQPLHRSFLFYESGTNESYYLSQIHLIFAPDNFNLKIGTTKNGPGKIYHTPWNGRYTTR